jgi:hypothetical protein
MEGSMALLWINRWIGHGTRTKHRDPRLEYRASESKSIKWVERKGLAWKGCRWTSEELVVAHITTNRPIREEANATTNNGCNTYYYGKNRHGHVKHACMTWQYDAMQLIQIKRNQNPDTHLYDSSCFTTPHINCWLTWQNKVWVS